MNHFVHQSGHREASSVMTSDMSVGDCSETQKWNSQYEILGFTPKNRSGKKTKVGTRFLLRNLHNAIFLF